MTFELRHSFLEADERARFSALAQRLTGMGVQRIRLNARWPEIEPQPGVYHWTDLDAAIDAILSAGMQVYCNLVDVPAHALGHCDSDGNWTPHPWEGYRSYFPSGSTQIKPTCWAGDVFNPTYDPNVSAECANPPRVMPASVRRIAAALKQHCAEKVKRFGVGNEMDERLFFPLWVLVSTKYSGDWQPVSRMIYEDVVRPFSLGIRDVDPSAFIEATESQTYGALATTLRIEKESGDHVIDGITTHGYADNWLHFPDDAIARITTKNGGLLQYLIDSGAWEGRPWGIGEVAPNAGDDPMSVLEYLAVMRHLGAQWVTLMMGEKLFMPGTYGNGTYEPNDLYRALAAQASRFAGRHRAANHG
jgi:hypothetical protein